MNQNVSKNQLNVEVAVLIYPSLQMAAVHGLDDLFLIAKRIHDNQSESNSVDGRVHFRLTHWQLSEDNFKECVFNSQSSPAKSPKETLKFTIIPPSLADPIARSSAAPYAFWLKEQHAAGSTLCSVCSGAYLLAETGLLNGRIATTHWTYADAFAARFPEVDVDTNRLLFDDGDLVTAGGLMSWTDIGLRVVERAFGVSVMLETARFMLLDPPGREQRYYRSFLPILNHGDEAILKVQHWLQQNASKEVNVQSMATKARLEERTFLRRFSKATGLTPTEYCQHLRVHRARSKLESTRQNVDAIAWSNGYEDAGAFRKVFKKIMGLTPGEYRARFNVAAAK